MTHSFLDVVLRGAEALAARDGVASLSDPDLLRRFATDRDQAAFAVLVRRHGPLVWGVCRNLLPADADAEDAFQATFLALVRSASAVRQTAALGGWLHAVAFRVAMKARRTAARRKKREVIAAIPEPDLPVPDAAWDDLQAAVHEEVCRLPEKLRIPFVLCGLQGRQQKDVAKQLGWKVGTVSGRLTLARQRLLDRLARRGVPVGMAAGAAVLGMASGIAAVPHSVSSKALAAAQAPDALSSIVISLARGVNPMSLTRTKLLVAGVLVAGALTTGLGSRFVSTADAQAPSSEPSPEAIKKALDYLRSHQSPDKWEYKFVPVDKALTPADLQKLLSVTDREGWEYCGTQDLVVAKATPTPHMVLKRPRSGAAAADDTRSAAAAALAALVQQQDAKNNDDRLKLLAELEKRNRALQAAQNDAILKSQQEANKARAALLAQEAAMVVEAEQAKKNAAQADALKNALNQERTRAVQMEAIVQQRRAEQEVLIKKIKDLEAALAAERGKAGARDAIAPTDTLQIPLKHVAADDALKAINKVMPAGGFRASIDTRSNTLVIQGSPDVLAKLRELIEKTVDAKPAESTAAARPDVAIIKLKNIDSKAAQDAVKKVLGSTKLTFAMDASTNSLVIVGPADEVLGARKVVESLDRPAGGGK